MYLWCVKYKGLFILNQRFTLSTKISKHISDEKFKFRSTNGQKGAFTRSRKLDFSSLLIFILQMGTKSLRREITSFINQIDDPNYNIKEVTKSALSQSRHKLNPSAFIELSDLVVEDYYAAVGETGYQGHRMLAVDGTRIRLPKSEKVSAEFAPTIYGSNDMPVNMATVSLLYDPVNLITLEAHIEPTSISERDLLFRHLEKVNPNDLLVLDRGYTGRAVMSILMSRGIHFIIRYNEIDSEIKAFVESGLTQQIVELKVSDAKFAQHKDQYPEMTQTIKVRLIKIETEDGGYKIIATSLMDSEKYPQEDFEELYDIRWGVEEAYKMLKSRAELEAFSGMSPTIIRQDLYSKILLMNLCAVWSSPIDDKVREEFKADKDRKHSQTINKTDSLFATKSILIDVFIKKKLSEAFGWFDPFVYKCREIIRHGRSYQRKKKPPKPKSMNYKHL